MKKTKKVLFMKHRVYCLF